MSTSTAPAPPRARAAVRPVVLVVLGLGTVVTAVAMTVLPWFHWHLSKPDGYADWVMGWPSDSRPTSALLWVLVVGCVAAAFGTASPRPDVARFCRVAAPCLAGLAIVDVLLHSVIALTAVPLDFAGRGELRETVASGLPLVLAGLLAVGAAGAIGLRRRRPLT